MMHLNGKIFIPRNSNKEELSHVRSETVCHRYKQALIPLHAVRVLSKLSRVNQSLFYLSPRSAVCKHRLAMQTVRKSAVELTADTVIYKFQDLIYCVFRK